MLIVMSGIDHGFGHLLIWLDHQILQLLVKAHNFQTNAALFGPFGPNDDQGQVHQVEDSLESENILTSSGDQKSKNSTG